MGQVRSSNPVNVVAERFQIRVEVRGATGDLREYMIDEPRRIVRCAAEMHDVMYRTEFYGKTTTFTSYQQLVEIVSRAAASVDGVTEVTDRETWARAKMRRT